MDGTQEQVDALYEGEVMSVDGDRLGPVRQVYVDDKTGVPTWVTVRTGWFGGREHAVPLEGAERTDDGLRVSASGPEIREAPTVEEDEHLGEAQLAELRRYYGLVPPAADEIEGAVDSDDPADPVPPGPAATTRRYGVALAPGGRGARPIDAGHAPAEGRNWHEAPQCDVLVFGLVRAMAANQEDT